MIQSKIKDYVTPPNKKNPKTNKKLKRNKRKPKKKQTNKNKRLELVYLSRKIQQILFWLPISCNKQDKTFLNKSIRNYQTGFFFGRYRLQGKIINQYDLINYTVINYIPCVTVMIDFGKAFDSLAREFIQLF